MSPDTARPTLEASSPSLTQLRRRLSELFPDAASAGSAGPTLEVLHQSEQQPPRIAVAPPLEGHTLRRRVVDGDPTVAFSAFLDGTQESRVAHFERGIPIVAGAARAVIRIRRNRRFTTWNHAMSSGLFVPLRALSAAARERFSAAGCTVIDTSDAVFGESDAAPPHPFSVTDAAVHAVQREREALERDLAIAWCDRESAPLFIDGSIAGNPRLSSSAIAVGVVKSHRVLYGGPDAFHAVVELRCGERTTAMRIESGHAKRSAVASWYLRLRDRGSDPLWGLVRVEVSMPEATESISARADDVSRWLLAEVAPLALPDGRWDRMMYGIRDCEEFLRAVAS